MFRVLGVSLLRHGARSFATSRQVRTAFVRRAPAATGPALRATSVKQFSNAASSGDQHRQEVEEINAKFAEAREEIELAAESKETVYFNDEVETAKQAVQEVLDKYEGLLGRLSPEEKGAMQRSMGLKMEQLKAELAQLKE